MNQKNKLKRLLLPVCWVVGHVHLEDESKPGWFAIKCDRCGRDRFNPYPWQIVRGRIPYMFLWLANKTATNSPSHKPQFRAIDQSLKGIGTEHSCGAYSYEHIKSYIDQRKGDGLPPPLLSDLISEDGWISVEDIGAEKFLDMINDDFEKQSNKAEREETMRIMNGEESEQS
jgi:hypothetical protein